MNDIEHLIHASMGKDFKFVEALPDLSDPIEVMARAMWRGPLPLDSHECRQFARLAIAGLAECGFAIVPVEPTQEMLRAACASMSPGKRPTKRFVSNSEKHGIRYRAMIAATPPITAHLAQGETGA